MDAQQASRLEAVLAEVMTPPVRLPEPPLLDPLEVARALESAFRQAATDAIEQAHRLDLAVPVISSADEVVWLHPDGALRASRDA